MARAQTKVKKGRASSSAKRTRTRRASSRPNARQMAGSKGKGRYSERTGDRSRTLANRRTGVRPEGSQPPTLVAGDAAVGEQRRAASRQRSGKPTNRPPGPTRRKPGARGGGPVDRQAERRTRRGDPVEVGRESTRGAEPRGGEEGRRARARRATPRRESGSARGDRRTATRKTTVSASAQDFQQDQFA